MSRKIAATKTGIGAKATHIYTGNLPEKGKYFQVQLYATVVYDEWPEYVTLRNGGWNTPTTAQRIDSALIHRGYQPGISRAGGAMSYRGQPFVNGELILKKSEMKRLSESLYVSKGG